MKQPFTYPAQLAFADTDASGWMHFPNIFRYVEAAEHELLLQLGVLIFDRSEGGWPRVHVSCDYAEPITTATKIHVILQLEKIGSTSLHWQFSITSPDSIRTYASGKMITVRVNHRGEKLQIPSDEREKLIAFS